jgi:hypothetical protein
VEHFEDDDDNDNDSDDVEDVFPCVGACCFRKWKDWTMQFAWLHPYFRRRQLLTAAWPQFEQEFGRFKLEPPLSPEMESGCAKVPS